MNRTKYLILAFIVFLSSCDADNVDITAPTMDVISYTPVPSEDEICGELEPVVFHIEGGDTLSFNVVFNDDVALSQYKIDIHNNFDCHGHGGGSAPSIALPNISNQTEDWTVLDIKSISGVSVPVERSLIAPENVTAGNYHFHIQVIDESGNDSPFTNYNSIKIKNPLDDVSPVINIEQPSNSSFAVNKGDVINFKGTVTDNRSLSDGGNGVLYLNYTDLSSGNSFSTNQFFPFEEDIETVFEFDFNYVVPQTLTTGSYRFSLGANDGVRNVASFIYFDVEVSN